MPRCKKCRHTFEKKAPNQIYCEDCSYWKQYGGGSIMKQLVLNERKIQIAADESGNPKVWTAAEYSQDELRRLIPTRG
jgi:hypothetical protein